MPKTRRSASPRLFRFNHDFPRRIRRLGPSLRPTIPTDVTGPREPRQVGDPDSPGFQPSFQALPNTPQKDLPGRRKEEGESDQVRENSRGEEEGPPQQNGKAIQERASGESAKGQITLDLPKGTEPLQPSQSRPGNTREHHQPDGRPNTYQLADLNQDEQLQERDPDKEEEEAAEQRHGGRYPPGNKKDPAGSRLPRGQLLSQARFGWGNGPNR